VFTPPEMSSVSRPERLARQIAGHLGTLIRDERVRRGWSLRDLAGRAGLSVTFVHVVEHGGAASLATYTALASALELQASFELIDPRRRGRTVRQEDPVHAAMGETLAERLSAGGLQVALDDPFQHYQFAGRADVLGWSRQERALLHIENRTRFPNLQETFGSYNTKRRYLPAIAADRLGVRRGWASVTNVVLALWSSEVLHEVRIHPASFRAVCPDPVDDFATWWSGTVPLPGAPTSTFALFDPIAGGRADRRRFVGLEAAAEVRPRYRGYADAVDALGLGRRLA
jgi:transcriptional regulator with XRE-family HTH domain